MLAVQLLDGLDGMNGNPAPPAPPDHVTLSSTWARSSKMRLLSPTSCVRGRMTRWSVDVPLAETRRVVIEGSTAWRGRGLVEATTPETDHEERLPETRSGAGAGQADHRQLVSWTSRIAIAACVLAGLAEHRVRAEERRRRAGQKNLHLRRRGLAIPKGGPRAFCSRRRPRGLRVVEAHGYVVARRGMFSSANSEATASWRARRCSRCALGRAARRGRCHDPAVGG